MAFEDGPLAPGWGFCPARLWVRCVGASLSLLLCNGTSPAAACPAAGRVGRVDRRVHQLPPGDVTRQPHRGWLLRCLGSAGRRALSAGCGLGGAGHGKPRSSAFPSASRPACNRACGSGAACTPIAFMRWEGPRCFCSGGSGACRPPSRAAGLCVASTRLCGARFPWVVGGGSREEPRSFTLPLSVGLRAFACAAEAACVGGLVAG